MSEQSGSEAARGEKVEEKIEVIEEPIPITKKDPRKVEQGKRLAMISKEAKERKMRARLEKEREDQKSYIPTIIAVGSSCGLLVTLLILWFRKPSPPPSVVREEDEPKKKKFVTGGDNKNFEEL